MDNNINSEVSGNVALKWIGGVIVLIIVILGIWYLRSDNKTQEEDLITDTTTVSTSTDVNKKPEQKIPKTEEKNPDIYIKG